jgi:hypothetical protein
MFNSKRSLIIIISLLLLATASAGDETTIDKEVRAIVSQAEEEHFDSIEQANHQYRATLAKAFRFADRIDVFLLDFSMGADPAYEPKPEDEVLEIRPYGRKTRILKSARVPAKDLPKWREAAAKMYRAKPENWATGCHYPVHGIRIYSGQNLLLETSFCWQCSNYQFSTTGGESSWVTMGRDADDLKALLQNFMPIPPEQQQRFEAGPQPHWKGGIF